MIAFRLGSGRPRPGSNCVVMVSTTPLGCICPHQFDETSHRTVRLAHRFTFRGPHIRRAYVVVLLRRTHHPANRKAQKAPGSNINENESYMNASTIDTTLTPATPAVGHYRIDPNCTTVRFFIRHLLGWGPSRARSDSFRFAVILDRPMVQIWEFMQIECGSTLCSASAVTLNTESVSLP